MNFMHSAYAATEIERRLVDATTGRRHAGRRPGDVVARRPEQRRRPRSNDNKH